MTRLASLLPAQVVALVPGSALAQRTVAPPPRSDPIHACSHPGQEHLRAAVEAVANADIDADAPVIWQARFTPRGLLVIVDAGLEEVVLMGGDLEPIRTVGRRGRGPGACSYPVYAVQGKDGTIFVLDRSPARLLLFDSLGNPLRTVSLPIVVGRSVAVDDTAAYVSAPVLWTVPDFQRALVVRYDLARGELTTLLETGPSWRSRPPTYNSSGRSRWCGPAAMDGSTSPSPRRTGSGGSTAQAGTQRLSRAASRMRCWRNTASPGGKCNCAGRSTSSRIPCSRRWQSPRAERHRRLHGAPPARAGRRWRRAGAILAARARGGARPGRGGRSSRP